MAYRGPCPGASPPEQTGAIGCRTSPCDKTAQSVTVPPSQLGGVRADLTKQDSHKRSPIHFPSTTRLTTGTCGENVLSSNSRHKPIEPPSPLKLRNKRKKRQLLDEAHKSGNQHTKGTIDLRSKLNARHVFLPQQHQTRFNNQLLNSCPEASPCEQTGAIECRTSPGDKPLQSVSVPLSELGELPAELTKDLGVKQASRQRSPIHFPSSGEIILSSNSKHKPVKPPSPLKLRNKGKLLDETHISGNQQLTKGRIDLRSKLNARQAFLPQHETPAVDHQLNKPPKQILVTVGLQHSPAQSYISEQPQVGREKKNIVWRNVERVGRSWKPPPVQHSGVEFLAEDDLTVTCPQLTNELTKKRRPKRLRNHEIQRHAQFEAELQVPQESMQNNICKCSLCEPRSENLTVEEARAARFAVTEEGPRSVNELAYSEQQEEDSSEEIDNFEEMSPTASISSHEEEAASVVSDFSRDLPFGKREIYLPEDQSGIPEIEMEDYARVEYFEDDGHYAETPPPGDDYREHSPFFHSRSNGHFVETPELGTLLSHSPTPGHKEFYVNPEQTEYGFHSPVIFDHHADPCFYPDVEFHRMAVSPSTGEHYIDDATDTIQSPDAMMALEDEALLTDYPGPQARRLVNRVTHRRFQRGKQLKLPMQPLRGGNRSRGRRNNRAPVNRRAWNQQETHESRPRSNVPREVRPVCRRLNKLSGRLGRRP